MQNKKTIIITGCSRGIGRAMTVKFLQLGHHVLGCSSSEKNIKALEQELGTIENFTRVDIGNASKTTAWAHSIIEQAGPPDLLINNAGIINEPKPFWEIDEGSFNRVIAVNVSGVANSMRAFLPHMVAAQKGTIINISSGAGIHGFPTIAPYCASKFAVEGLSQSVAQELPEGMACIPLSPGVINTEMLQDYWGKQAHTCDTPEAWAQYAVPYMLTLGPEHNGQSLRVPQET